MFAYKRINLHYNLPIFNDLHPIHLKGYHKKDTFKMTKKTSCNGKEPPPPAKNKIKLKQ